MIEDLDGAAPSPSRRGHVVALSAVSAAVSLALFALLIVPPSGDSAAPGAVSPMSSPRESIVMTLVGTPLHHLRLDLTRDSVCPDGTRLIPPYHLVSDGNSGEVFAVRYVVGGTNRSVPVHLVPDKRPSYWSVTCGRRQMVAPWDRPLDIAR